MRKGTKGVAWTTAEVEWLRLYYGMVPTDVLAAQSNRTTRAIQMQARRCGLYYWSVRFETRPVDYLLDKAA